MITLNTSTLVLLILAAGLVGALASVMPAWRGTHKLPVWAFLHRRAATIERVAALQAELRCEMCAAKVRCKQLLAEGADTPVPGCPNAALFTALPAGRAEVRGA